MRKRPIGPLVDALRSLGIDATAETGCPPVTVKGTGRFEASRVEIDAGLSSQYVSALLMMAAGGDRPVDIELAGEDIGARGYIDLTRRRCAPSAPRSSRSSPVTWRVEPTGYTRHRFRHRAGCFGRDLSLGGRSADRRPHRSRRADRCLHPAGRQGL